MKLTEVSAGVSGIANAYFEHDGVWVIIYFLTDSSDWHPSIDVLIRVTYETPVGTPWYYFITLLLH